MRHTWRESRHRWIGVIALLLATTLAAPLSNALNAGDVAIIGVRADDIAPPVGNGNDDGFAWVPLVALAGNAEIFFTDAGWTAAANFRPQEGAIKYTAPAAGLPAGTVMLLEYERLISGDYTFMPSGGGGTYSNANDANVGTVGLLPATPGDNIFIFEGSSAAPSFIWGWKNEGPYDADATSNDTTALPPGLTVGSNALATGSGFSTDNNRYAGSTTGTPAQLAALIANPANWEAVENMPFPSGGNDITNGTTGSSFTVSGANSPPTVNAGADQTINFGTNASLAGTVTDDGEPNPPGATTVLWTQVSGPGTTTFGSATAASTTASFSVAGVYVLRLSANDSDLTGSDDVTISVNAAPVVNAGADQAIDSGSNASLSAAVTDDGLPNPPGATTVLWTQVSGPGSTTFGNATAASTTASFSVDGVYVLRLTANDSSLTGSDDLTISVNAAPVVNAGADQTINTGTNASLSGTVTDDGLPNPPAATTVLWSQVSGPGSTTFGNPAAAATTASFTVDGVYVLRLTANDSSLSGSDDVTISVNAAPVVNAGADQTIDSGTNASLVGTVTDDGLPNPPAATTVLWSQISGPGTTTFGNATAASTTASFSVDGVYVLRLTANDSALTGSDDVTVSVNGAPVVNAGADQTINSGMSATLAATVTDDGLPNPPGATTVLWTQVSGPGTTTFGNPAAAATTASFSADGVYVLRLTADDSSRTGSDDLTVSVNAAPAVNAGADQTINTGTSATLAATVTDDGLPNPPGAITLLWTQVSGPGTTTFGNPAAAATTASFSVDGVYVLRLTADDSALTNSDDITISVNAAPVVNAGADQTINSGTSATLAATVTDDGLPNPPGAITLLWTQVSGPGTTTFGNPAAAATTASFSADGVYVLRLTADDSSLTASDDVTISVNAAPAVNAGADQTINTGTSATLAATVTDDGLPNPPAATTVLWTQVSGPGTTTFGNPAAAATTASFSADGVYVLRLTADDSALTNTDDITVSVNAAPVVNAGADQTINSGTSATLAATVTDDGLPNPPGATTLLWTQVSGPGATTFGNPAAAATTASFSADGVYVLRLTADDSALTHADDITVSVNAAPVVNAGADQTINTGTSAALAATVTDDGLPNPPAATAVLWTQVSGPGTTTFGAATAASTTASFSADGVYVLRLTADDSALTHSDDITVSVNAAPVVNAGADQTINSGTSAALAGTVTDDGLPNPPGATTLLWTQVSGPGATTFGDATAAGTTAGFSADGVYVLRLTANDSALSGSDDVTISVNAAPVVNAGADQTIDTGSNAGLSGTVTDDGLPNPPGAIAVLWTQVSGPGTTTFGAATAASTTASFSADGVYVLRLTADDSALTGSDDVTISVNAAPVVNAGADQTIATGTSASLAGTITDDGLPNPPAATTVLWTQVSGPGTTTFGNATAAGTTASFSVDGVYVLRLTANDSSLAGTDEVTISVNAAPSVDAGADQAVDFPAGATLAATVNDDGLPNPPASVTLQWTQVSGPGATTFADPTVAMTTVSFSAAGTYVLRLTADDSVLNAFDEISIAVNAAPTVDAGPDQNVDLPADANLAGVITDDGLPNPPGAFTAQWTQVSGLGTATFADASSAATTVSFSAAGNYVLRLTADDGSATVSDDLTVTVNAAADIDVTPTSIAFGAVTLDTTPPAMDVTVTNTGGSDLNVTANALSGPNQASFALGGTCVGTLTAAANCTLSITYDPLADASDGAKTATLTIDSSDPDEAQVQVALTASNMVGDLSVTPRSLDLGQVAVTQNGSAVVTVATTAAIRIDAITLGGQDLVDFSFGTDCPIGTLFSAGNCSITATFAPLSVGLKSATITIDSLDADEPSIVVTLVGEGTPAPAPSGVVSPTALDFGNLTVGTSATQDVTVTNTGTADLTLGTVGGVDMLTTPYSFAADGCSGQMLAPQASCTITVQAMPAATGLVTNSFDIPSDDPVTPSTTVTVSVNGTAEPTADIATNPAGLDFGQVEVGMTASQDITVSNAGDAPLTIASVSSDSGLFTTMSDCGVLAPAATCTVSVQFMPTSEGAFDANLTILSDDPDESVLVLGVMGSGFVVPVPMISLDTLMVDFGPTAVGASATPRDIVVTNTGAADLIISAIDLSGNASGAFAITHGCTTLAPAASCTVSAVFTPASLGAASASVDISSNDPQVGQISATLNGTGSGDTDGVDDAIENAAPNNGDGNADGIADAGQPNVVSILDLQGDYITLSVAAGMTFSGLTVTANPYVASTPATVTFSATGFVGFTVENVAPNTPVSVQMNFHGGNVGDTYWKFGPELTNTTPHFFEFLRGANATGAAINGNVVTLTLIDGAIGDNPLSVADGRIVDPGSPGMTVPSTVPVTVQSRGGGTLGPWLLTLLALAVAWRVFGSRQSAHRGQALALMALCVLLGAAPPANADWYMGLGAGVSDADTDTSDLVQRLAARGWTIQNATVDSSDVGGKAFVGYSFAKWWAVEATLLDMGRVTTDFDADVLAASVPLLLADAEAVASHMIRGLSFTGLISTPLDEHQPWRAFAKAGVVISEARSTIGSGGGVAAARGSDDSETNLVWGVGGGLWLTPDLELRFDWDRYEVDDAIDFIGLSLQARF